MVYVGAISLFIFFGVVIYHYLDDVGSPIPRKYLVKSNEDSITIKGEILSVKYNDTLLLGDPNAEEEYCNTINQSSSNYNLVLKGGHLNVQGKITSLKINSKEINLQ